MSVTSIAQAKSFISAAELPKAPAVERGATSAQLVAFDTVKSQAAVVGSEVISFAQGITAEQRQDISNAALLAQLVAKRKVPLPETQAEIKAWYRTYFDALSHLGFAVQDQGFTTYQYSGDTFEVHEAILEVAAALLAGSPGALALVNTTLKALRKMSDDSSWITVFNRESQSAHAARFQISAVERDATGVFVSMLAFGLEANSTLTQVLFFKFHKQDATLFNQGGKVSVNEQVLAGVRDAISAKLTGFANDFIKALPDDLGAPEPASFGGEVDFGGGSRWRGRGIQRNFEVILPGDGGGEYDI